MSDKGLNESDFCTHCGESLWQPSKKHPEILLRFVHVDSVVGVRTKSCKQKIMKLLSNDPTLSDTECRKRGILTSVQEGSIQRAIAEPTHGVLVGDTMGAGKTSVATEIALRLDLPRVLIIAPRNTLGQWAERFTAQSDGDVRVRRLDSTKAGQAAFADFMAGEPGVFTVTSQWLTKQDYEYRPAVDPDTGEPLFKIDKKTGIITDEQEVERIHLKVFKRIKPLDMVIFDEIHAIQNRKSITARTVDTLPIDWRVGMSGTWHGNNFAGAWSTTRWVWPEHIDGSYWRWVEEYCEQKDVYVAGGRAVAQVAGEKNPGTFAASLPCYIRNMPFEDAPAPMGVYVDISPSQRAQYLQLEESMMAWTSTEEPIVADLPIVLRQRLRTAALAEMSLDTDGQVQFAEDAPSAKLGALRGVLDSFNQGCGRVRPAVIFTDSKKFALIAAKRMEAAGYRARAWTGDSTEKQRGALKQQFLDGEFDYMVASIAASAVGLDGWQTRASAIVWLSKSEDGLLNDQAVARVWRPGMTEEYGDFVQVEIMARDTLDDGTFLRLRANRELNQRQMAA